MQTSKRARSAEELQAIKAKRLCRLYEAIGTPTTDQLQIEIPRSASTSPIRDSKTQGKERQKDKSSSPPPLFPEKQLVAMVTIPDPSIFVAIPCEPSDPPDSRDVALRETNRSHISAMYQQAVRALPSSLQLPSLQMQVLDTSDQEMTLDAYDALMVERRINQALREEGEQEIKLPMIKCRDWASRPHLALYAPEQGHPDLVGREVISRLVELSQRKPVLHAKVVFWLYELEHYLLVVPRLHSREDVPTMLR